MPQVIKKFVVTVTGDDSTDYGDEADDIEATVKEAIQESVAAYNADSDPDAEAISVEIEVQAS